MRNKVEREYLTALKIMKGIITLIEPDGTIGTYRQRGMGNISSTDMEVLVRAGLVDSRYNIVKELPKHYKISFEDKEIMGNCEVAFKIDKSRITQLRSDNANIVSQIATLTYSTFAYNLIQFGSCTEFADYLKPGDKICVKYENIIVSDVTIGSVKGRLTGLSKIIRSKLFFDNFDLHTNEKIELRYYKSNKIVEILKLESI